MQPPARVSRSPRRTWTAAKVPERTWIRVTILRAVALMACENQSPLLSKLNTDGRIDDRLTANLLRCWTSAMELVRCVWHIPNQKRNVCVRGSSRRTRRVAAVHGNLFWISGELMEPFTTTVGVLLSSRSSRTPTRGERRGRSISWLHGMQWSSPLPHRAEPVPEPLFLCEHMPPRGSTSVRLK